MKQIGKRTILLGAAALCWGIMFPEYTFTADSYTAFVQEIEEENEIEGMEQIEEAESVEELYRAIRDGKVRYRFRLYEYLKNHLFGRMENELEGSVIPWRELCTVQGECRDLKGALFIYGEYGTRQICADRSI